MTNVSRSVLDRLNSNLYERKDHPLGILNRLIQKQLPDFEIVRYPSPIVSPHQNFDQLGFPADHPGRRRGDSYYINSNQMLRTHTSAHEIETFASGRQKWLITADVYRRDEIDASHFPIFHQMEGARVATTSKIEEFLTTTDSLKSHLSNQNIQIEDLTQIGPDNPYQLKHKPEHARIVAENLKATINSLIFGIFKDLDPAHQERSGLKIRWIPAYFPFTSPSYEVEVMYMGKWLEILGCGVVEQKTLDEANVPEKIGWAFGLGLERIAMVLFSIPDIRLFWSNDPRFHDQFKDQRLKRFKMFSKNPACYKDLSFWVPEGFEVNDFYEIIRAFGGSWIEEVKLIDEYVHPKSKRKSQCYRIGYRSMEKTLSNEEVNLNQVLVLDALKSQLGLEFR
ncbi:phenylalanyl-tRNA synthetase [Phakopsora pachyrhizi]|nr:phenylalanyl-tRNA synthetase [Phakopsora pachyrhizi]